MRQWRPILIGAVGAVLSLFVLLLSGLLNFAASSGHWDVTDWVLDIAARQSVTLRSAGIEVPALDDPRMIRRGAGHYELVCAACHGSPGREPEAFAAHLTPRPPLLLDQMQHWRPAARVFWTVQHGIKRSAMPAWPTQLREDEVWEVVAFLEAMPKLTAAEYRELAGDRRSANMCSNCHGEDGRGRGEAFPRLDIQSPAYLADALHAFRDGTRASGTMITAASGLTNAQIEQLAAFYGKSSVEPISGNARGREIAERGIPERDVAACDSCHGSSARPQYPSLAGQKADYIVTQLKLFSELGEGRGGLHAEIMAKAVAGLEEDEMRAVAAWYGE